MEWWRGLAHPHPAWGSLYTYQNHPKTFKKCLDKRPTKCQKWADNVMTKVRTSFRFEEGDIEGWKRAAEREGLTLSEWMRTGKVIPEIDRQYSLSETGKALAYVEEGHARAKVVINIS